MEFFETLEKRHSVRSFQPDPIPQELIDKVLAAAARAPSSFNLQPWHFYVTRGESRARVGEIMAQSTTYLEEFIEVLGPERYEQALSWYSDLGKAPVVIVCTAAIAEDALQEVNRLVAVGAAIENMLLAATAVGLGACNVSFAFMVRQDITEALEIPEDRTVVSILALGYPSDEPVAAPPHDMDVADFLD